MSEEDKLREVFKENLNNFFLSHGKTQKDLANYMEVSPATVNEWMKGRKLPRMDKVDKLCTYFSINRSDLMERSTISHLPPLTEENTHSILARAQKELPQNKLKQLEELAELFLEKYKKENES